MTSRMKVLVWVLVGASAGGWGLAMYETREADRFRRSAHAARLDLETTRAATGLLTDIERRIQETQRREVQLELERAELQAEVNELRGQIGRGKGTRAPYAGNLYGPPNEERHAPLWPGRGM